MVEQIKSNTLSALTFLSLRAEKDCCSKFDCWGKPACMHANAPKEQIRLNEFLTVTFLFFDKI